MRWLFPFVVLILSAGFAKLSVATLNWWFARRMSKPVLVASHVLNIALILGYPLLLITGPVSSHLRLLLDGHINRVPFACWLTLAAGAGGLCLLIWSTIEFQLYAPPMCQTGCESHRVDLRRKAGPSWHTTFVGPGPMRRIALLPGNEQFTIDVSTKTYSLPSLPAEWDGLSLVQLSDLHFRGAVTRAYFEAVCEQAAALKPDLFVFTGDLLDDPRLIAWLPETLGKLTAPRGQYFILGNHDWYFDSAAIRRELERLGWTDLAGRCVSLNKPDAVPVVLCGDETPWMGTHPDLSSVSAESFRILLSHTPDNITWARQQGIDLMLSGHTHGGQIRLPILGPVYSPSRFGCRYSAGVFWLAPTLLHVSRGLSGREPIRYNCPPELTKLVLKCGSQVT
ncbi:MAG: metallophosphoesterase [Planctomycetota bacterium]